MCVHFLIFFSLIEFCCLLKEVASLHEAKELLIQQKLEVQNQFQAKEDALKQVLYIGNFSRDQEILAKMPFGRCVKFSGRSRTRRK